ncbi:hypothetical protein L1887_23383 [Cichorium endivia]|nr:hypothetical protein L1887_23383 [Cichorium endivia]
MTRDSLELRGTPYMAQRTLVSHNEVLQTREERKLRAQESNFLHNLKLVDDEIFLKNPDSSLPSLKP